MGLINLRFNNGYLAQIDRFYGARGVKGATLFLHAKEACGNEAMLILTKAEVQELIQALTEKAEEL